jgi:two-component system, response regulator
VTASSGPVDILLVEDNADDVELTLRALRKANLAQRVEVARDGAEALTLLFGSDGPTGSRAYPRVVLLDVQLPGVGGLEVLHQIRAHAETRALPVIMLTSSCEEPDVHLAYRLGANSYVVKPVDYASFGAAVQQLGSYWLRLNEPSIQRE